MTSVEPAVTYKVRLLWGQFCYSAECQLATLAHLKSRKRVGKLELRRQTRITEQMVAAVLDFGEALPDASYAMTFPRLTEIIYKRRSDAKV